MVLYGKLVMSLININSVLHLRPSIFFVGLDFRRDNKVMCLWVMLMTGLVASVLAEALSTLSNSHYSSNEGILTMRRVYIIK